MAGVGGREGLGAPWPRKDRHGVSRPCLHPGWPRRGKWAPAESLTTLPPSLPVTQRRPGPALSWCRSAPPAVRSEAWPAVRSEAWRVGTKDGWLWAGGASWGLGQFSPTSSPALPQATRVKGRPQLPVHIPFSALVSPLPTLLQRAGLGKAEATVLLTAISPARTWMKQPERPLAKSRGQSGFQSQLWHV